LISFEPNCNQTSINQEFADSNLLTPLSIIALLSVFNFRNLSKLTMTECSVADKYYLLFISLGKGLKTETNSQSTY